MILSGKKFLILLIYTPIENRDNFAVTGRTRLMKMAFLFDKEIKHDFQKDNNFEKIELPEFIGWKYGPFSRGILNDLEFLINQGYIAIQISSHIPIRAEQDEYRYWADAEPDFLENEFVEESFILTADIGVSKGKELWSHLTANQINLLTEFKRALVNAPLERILEYVYKKYKVGYTDKSLIKDRFF